MHLSHLNRNLTAMEVYHFACLTHSLVGGGFELPFGGFILFYQSLFLSCNNSQRNPMTQLQVKACASGFLKCLYVSLDF